MLSSRLEYLLNGYIKQSCSREEEEELMNLLSTSENEVEVKKLLDTVIANAEPQTSMADQTANLILQDILTKEKGFVVPIKKKKPVFSVSFRAAAAIMILFVSATVYWLLSTKHKDNTASPVALSTIKPATILPGGNHAILILGDGSRISLDSLKNGNIKGGSAEIKKQGSVLMYDASVASKKDDPLSYNTLATPRGGQYKIGITRWK